MLPLFTSRVRAGGMRKLARFFIPFQLKAKLNRDAACPAYSQIGLSTCPAHIGGSGRRNPAMASYDLVYFRNSEIVAFDDFSYALRYSLTRRRRLAVAGAGWPQMKTFGQALKEARKKAGITQRELAARLKREDGRPVDPPYLNAVEHDHRYPPEDYLIEQMAKIVGVSPDVLYFHANRQPPDVKTGADQERLEAAYRAFRKALGVKPPGRRK